MGCGVGGCRRLRCAGHSGARSCRCAQGQAGRGGVRARFGLLCPRGISLASTGMSSLYCSRKPGPAACAGFWRLSGELLLPAPEISFKDTRIVLVGGGSEALCGMWRQRVPG